jgi:hypothetical protein
VLDIEGAGNYVTLQTAPSVHRRKSRFYLSQIAAIPEEITGDVADDDVLLAVNQTWRLL